jgi:UDP-glucose/galactose:(glucosyl)LPS alpha-1,2-glucosyl/galactosyltransferase
VTHHIALCAGGAYLRAGAVVVAGLVRLTRTPEPVEIWVFHSGVSAADESLYRRAVRPAGQRGRLHLRPLPPDILALAVESDYITAETFGRLALPRLLPPSVSRVLYLDADLLVVGDVAELLELDLHGAPLAAVREATDPFLGSLNGLEHVFELGIDPRLPYFNAGVLLMDLAHLRRAEAEAMCLEYVRRHRPARMDQDALNAVFHNEFLELPTKWNVEKYYFKTPERRLRYRALLEDAGILHFEGHKKPWTHPTVWHSSEWAAELCALQ